jgi:glycosyltransferase involved in cell wall biosynthesis
LLADVKKEDRLLLYGAAEYLPLLVWIRRKQTYFEVTECPDLFKPRTYPWRYYKSLWKRLNGIFVISGNLKQYFVDYGVSPYKVHVINMIVDPKRFESVQRNPNAEKYIAYCGNVNKDSKDGVGDLIASFVRYHEKYSDRKLYIIGPIVSQEQKQEYEEYLRLYKALDSVVFTDSVSPTTIPQYFVDAEMLVLARPDNIQAKYGFPTKLGEYLLSGRPVVLTDVGNITDFLKDGVSAFIAKPGDINCISDKMMEVSANPEKNDSVAIAGKEVAMKEFNSSTEVLKIINLMYK